MAALRSRSVVLLATDLADGGAQRAMLRAALTLRSAGYVVTIAGLRGGALRTEARGLGFAALALASTRAAWPLAAWRLFRLLRRERPRVLHGFLFHAGIIGRIVAWLAGTPRVLVSVRVLERGRPWHLWIERLAAPLVDRLLCVSPALARALAREAHIPRPMLTVTENGLDPDRFGTHEPGARSLLAIARLERQKGLDVLLEALSAVDGLDLDILGDGPDRLALAERAQVRGLAGRLRFRGWVADVRPYLRTAVALVLPSRWEGQPNAVLEAMAAGCPVVASAVDGVVDLIEQGETGLLVPPGDAAALAAALRAIRDAPESARARAQRARAQVAARHTEAQEAAALLRVYSKIL